MEKLTKKELKEPDKFIKLASKVTDFVQTNIKLVAVFVLTLVLLGAAYGIYDFWGRQKEEKAQVALFTAQKKYASLLKEAQDAQTKKVSEDTKTKKKGEAPAPIEPAKAGYSEELVGAFKSVMDEYPQSKASVLAAVQLGDYFLENKKANEAVEVLEKKTKGPKDFLTGLLYLQLGRAQEAKGDCQAALQSWEKVIADNDLSYFRPEALLKSGLCYETLKQTAKAQEMYQKVTVDHAESAAALAAKKYQRLMKGQAG